MKLWNWQIAVVAIFIMLLEVQFLKGADPDRTISEPGTNEAKDP